MLDTEVKCASVLNEILPLLPISPLMQSAMIIKPKKYATLLIIAN